MYLISSLERARALDRLAGPAQRAARLLPPGRVRDALHGVWLGHPLHPVLAQAPAGTWLSASLLDAWPGGSPGTAAASRRLVLAGLAAALPAALAGSADWSELHEQQMRVGVVHALANTAAVALYAASLAAPDRAARRLRLAGLTAVATGGLLGGHLAFRQSAGANQAEPVPHLTEPGWHDLMTAAELAGLAERCSHLSGPLSEGDYRDGCLTCPWHGSTFRVSDGTVARGPATAPQPNFRTRIADGTLQACLPGAG